MDKYLIKRPRLSVKASENPRSHIPVAGVSLDTDQTCTTSAACMDIGASPSTLIAGNVYSSPPTLNVTSTAIPVSHGPLGETRPPPAKTKGRGYLRSWESTYGWLSYDEQTGKVYCATCVTANDKQFPLPCTSREKDSHIAFVKTGFQN
ncbi:unnamed protein product [Ixodes persulcatus]